MEPGAPRRSSATHRARPAHWSTAAPDCVVLGCTHFPLLRDVIRERCGPGVAVVDSAATTAAQVARILRHSARLVAAGHRIAPVPASAPVLLTCLATDNAERFARVGVRFLGESLDAEQVELIDI